MPLQSELVIRPPPSRCNRRLVRKAVERQLAPRWVSRRLPPSSVTLIAAKDHDGNRHQAFHSGRYFSSALPPLPERKHFSLFHLPRIPQDARTLSRLQSEV